MRGPFLIAAGVTASARAYGLTEDTDETVARMARLSAPITHPAGNRRFEDFLFQIRGDLVANLRRFSGHEIIYEPLSADQRRGLLTLLG